MHDPPEYFPIPKARLIDWLDADAIYELCPECRGEPDGCVTCWDEALVPHIHKRDPAKQDGASTN